MIPARYMEIRQLANKLMASCAPNELWQEVEELTQEECKVLDSMALECTCCNHWFATHTMSGDEYVCEGCK